MDYKLLYNFLTVQQPRTGISNIRSEYWDSLFAYYNNNLPKGERPLHTGCGICYIRVWMFCRKVLRDQCHGIIQEEAAIDKQYISNEFRSQNIV